MSNIFKQADIKAGYLLRVRRIGETEEFNMTVVPGCAYGEEALAVCCPCAHWWPLSCFDKKLQYRGTEDFEVTAVYGFAAPKFLLANSTDGRELLWERQEATKKMTVAEIAEALGHPIEIVED